MGFCSGGLLRKQLQLEAGYIAHSVQNTDYRKIFGIENLPSM